MSPFLESQGYELFFEVKHSNGSIADIVGKKGDEILVCEVKKTSGLKLYAQAKKWLGEATKVVVASPMPFDRGVKEAFCQICKDQGIGVLEITDRGVVPLERPKYNGRATLDWQLADSHKTSAPAGTQSGGRVTKHSDCHNAIRDFVSDNPGCSIAEIDGAVPHPFGKGDPGKKRLLDAIRKNNVKGLQLQKRNGTWWVYLEGMNVATGRISS